MRCGNKLDEGGKRMQTSHTTLFHIPPQLLVDELENSGHSVIFHRGKEGIALTGMRFLTPKSALSPERQIAYVIQPSCRDFGRINAENCVITFQEASDELIRRGCSIITVIDADDPAEIFNCIEEILKKYDLWNNNVNLSVQQGDLQTLVALGREIFGNPLFVHDNNYNYLARQGWIAGQTEPVINRRTGLGMIPVEVINDLLNSQAYKKTMGTHGAMMYEDFSIDSYRVLYVNLWRNKKYVGRLCIDEMANPILPGHFPLAEYYSIKILEAIQNQTSNINKQFTDLERILMNQIDGKQIDSSELNECLTQLDWTHESNYLVSVIRLVTKPGGRGNAAICFEIESSITECCAYEYSGGVVSLFNLTAGNYSESQITKRITDLLGDQGWIAGCSTVFQNLELIPIYHCQAQRAAEIGKLMGISGLVKYESVKLKSVLYYGMKNIQLKTVLPEELTQLMEYDRENRTDLVASLREFIRNDGNLSHAAERLYIHRTTLIYRIARIQEITGLRFDEETKLLLNICFYIMNNDSLFSA